MSSTAIVISSPAQVGQKRIEQADDQRVANRSLPFGNPFIGGLDK